MGDWNISRRRYFGLPLPIYPCMCGHPHVIGSKAGARRARHRRARPARGAAPAVDRPRADPLRGVRRQDERDPRGRRRLARRRHRPLLDARLAEPGVGRRTATRPAPRAGCPAPTCPTTPTGRSGSRPTGSRRCASRSGSGSTRSSSCRSRSSGRAPFRSVLGYEKMLDEHGREMHGSWGNMIEAEDAFDRMGADVMRWQYCAQPPDRNLLFGFGPAHEIKRQLLTLWNSVVVPRPVREHRGLHADVRGPRAGPGRSCSRSTAGWSRARSGSSPTRPTRSRRS